MSAAMNQFNFTIPAAAVPTHVQTCLQIFVGFTVYILTLRINSECHDEAKAFIEFYTETLATPIVYESQITENGSQLSPKFSSSKSVILPSKFNQESVQLYLPAITKSLDAEKEKIGYIRNLIYEGRQATNYYVIFGPKFMRDAPDFTQSLKTFKNIAAPARFLFVWDLFEIDILCIFCPYAGHAQSLYPLQNPINIKTLIKTDKEINRNMLQTKVRMYGTDGVQKLCLPSAMFRILHLMSCTVYEIITRANATIKFTRAIPVLYDTEWGDNYVSYIIGNMYDGVALELKNRQRKIPFEWGLIREFSREPTFVNVVETRGMGVSAIVSAFSLHMWLAVLGAALSVAAVLTAAYQRMYSSVVDNFKFSLVLVFSLALDRFDVSCARVRNSTMLIVLFIFVWAQLSTVLNNSYKGYLFSLLASKYVPDVPKDIEGLATTPTFMFSVAHAFASSSTRVSLYHYQINELLRMRNRTNDGLGDLIEQMNHRLMFSPLEIYELMVLQANSKSNRTSMIKWDKSKEEVKIPKNHIFVGRYEDVTAYTFTLNMVSQPEEHQSFVYGEGLPLLRMRLPFFIQPNFFYRIFVNRMFGLVESGILAMWRLTYLSRRLLVVTKHMAFMAENEGVKVISPGRVFLQFSYHDLMPPKPDIVEQPLTIEFIGGPLQVLGLSFVMGVVVLFFEYVRGSTASRVGVTSAVSSRSKDNTVLTVGEAQEELREAESEVQSRNS